MMLVSAAIVAALAVAVSAKDPAEGWMVSAPREGAASDLTTSRPRLGEPS